MRICVVGLRGIPGVMGGVETHCEQLYPRLTSLRPQDEIVIIGRRPYVPAPSRPCGGLRVVPLFAARSAYLEAITNTFVGVLHARFRQRAEILHIHAIGPALLTPLAKLLGMKVVVTHHGDDYRRAKWNWAARAALRVGEHVGVAFADFVIPVSQSVTQRLQTRYPRRAARLQHIPNGADHQALNAPADARGDPLRRHDLLGRRYVICVGRLVPEKRVEDVVAAFGLHGGYDRLVVVGGGGREERYARTLTSRPPPGVVFTGPLPREEVDALLRGAALFVLASSHEGLPIVALEAIRAGAPVLLSDIAPNRDLGLPPEHYFKVADPAALAAAMRRPAERLRVDPEILARFTWSDISARTNAVYDRVARRAPAETGATT